MSYQKLLQITGEVIYTARLFNKGDAQKIEELKGMVKILKIIDICLIWDMDTNVHIKYIEVKWKSFVEKYEI